MQRHFSKTLAGNSGLLEDKPVTLIDKTQRRNPSKYKNY